MLAFLFVDGLGLSKDERSPLQTLELPTLQKLTRNFSSDAFTEQNLAYRVLDASLGVEGLPQSGTGQTTLLTGINAAELLGHHSGPHPMARLQEILKTTSVQVQAASGGVRVLHANSYRKEYLDKALNSRRNMLSAFGFAAKSAGIDLLEVGHKFAVSPAFWENPKRSAERFASICEQFDLAILENWALDYSAHRAPEELNQRFTELDLFVQGWLEASPSATLFITADHGNAEEPWHLHHSVNPVPFIAIGKDAGSVGPMSSLTDVAPWIRKVLSL